MQLRTKLASLGLAALVSLASPVLADNGKSNGGKSNNGNSTQHSNSSGGQSSKGNSSAAHSDKSNHGDLASELKGLNAVKANPNALDKASPNSQVGRIAQYQDAALATIAVQDGLEQAAAELAALPVPDRNLASIAAAIAALDPASATYAHDLAVLTAEQAAALAYADAKAAVAQATKDLAQARRAEEAALLRASNGRVLSAEAIAYVRDILGL